MSRFPIAYIYVTCTAPGQDRCPDFLLPTRHMHCPRTGQMSRFPIAYTSHALPQDRTNVQISYCLHVTCMETLQFAKNIDAKHYYFKSKKHASIVPDYTKQECSPRCSLNSYSSIRGTTRLSTIKYSTEFRVSTLNSSEWLLALISSARGFSIYTKVDTSLKVTAINYFLHNSN